MPRGKQAVFACAHNIAPIQALLGTPKHAYEVLRLREIGLDFGVFYRAWRSGQTTEACSQVLGIVRPELEYELKMMFEEDKRIIPERIRISDDGVHRAAYWIHQERKKREAELKDEQDA